jgi:TRAP-type C4-dicarboxylate transport system permease small subunit
MSSWLKILDYLEKILEFIASLFLAAMTIIIFYQVVSRKGFNITPSWSEGVALLLMVWFGFVGMYIGIKRDAHLRIEIVYKKMPRWFQAGADLFNNLLLLIWGSILTVYGWRLADKVGGRSSLSFIPLTASYLYGVVPLVGVCIVLYSITKLAVDLHNSLHKGSAPR